MPRRMLLKIKHVTKNKPFQHKEPPLLVTVRLLDYGETPPILKSKRKCSCWLSGLYKMLLLFSELHGCILHYENN